VLQDCHVIEPEGVRMREPHASPRSPVQPEPAPGDSEAWLRLAMEAAEIGTFLVDVASRTVQYSPELATMLGFPAVRKTRVEDAMARVHRDDVERVRDEFESALRPDGMGRLRMELRFVRPGGEIRWMTWNGRVDFRDEPDGRRAHRILGACADITDRRAAETRLRESEERFRALTQLSSDWYWEQDEELRFIDVSSPVEQLAGSSAGSHIGKRRWELPAVGVSEAEWAAHRALLERREPFRNLEYRRVNEKGEIIWMSVNGDPIFDAAGRFKGYRGTGHNITERKQADMALRASEQLNRMTLQALPAHIAVLDDTGKIIAVNDAWREFAVANGAAGHQSVAVGANYLAVCRRAISTCPDAELALDGLQSVLSGQATQFSMDYPCHSPLEARWFLMTVVPFALEQGGGAVVSHLNVTAQKAAEIALRESEARFRLLADNAPVLIWVAGPESADFFNRPYLEFVGVESEADLAGSAWTRFLHPDDREPYVAAFRKAMRADLQFEAQVRLLRHDGTYRWMKSIAVPRRTEDGRCAGSVGSTLDITDLKLNEERIELLVRELDHRVKNILARVQVVIERTADAPLSTPAFVAALRSRIHSMSRAHELLSRSRWTGAKLMTVISAQLDAYATAANLELSGPDVTLSPEATQALSVVINELATNAAKYGALSAPSGRVVVSCSLAPVGDAPSALEIDWREEDGPAVGADRRHGYGTSAIAELLTHELDGEVDLTFPATGVRCRIRLPLAEVLAQS
jgi:PAS domain S-box-containing protein